MQQPKKEYKKQPSTFLYVVVAAWVFVITLTGLNLFGLVPYYMDGTPSNAVVKAAAKRDAELEAQVLEQERLASIQAQQEPAVPQEVLPTRLVIPITGTDVPISNPNTTDIEELDNELLTAVVRYPGSGTLGIDGNMFIFGHSTGYRTVNNEMFRAFNGLKDLEKGNVIKLVSGTTEYIYSVDTLIREDASNITVEFNTQPGVQRLTLSTCDSFGKKSDRYVVTADFVGSYRVGEYDTL
jgi:LPXTG-site transpeptidase (sortase) family protein